MQVSVEKGQCGAVTFRRFVLELSRMAPLALLLGLDGLEPLLLCRRDEGGHEVVESVFDSLSLAIAPALALARVLTVRDDQDQLAARSVLPPFRLDINADQMSVNC